MTFRTKLLNIFAINEEKTWWTPRQAQSLIGDFNVDKLPDGAPIVVSIDLSVHDDLTCIGYTYYDQQNKHFYIHNEYYLPEEAVKEHPNHSLYKLWHEQGYLKYCKGEAIDVYQIANEIYPRTRMNILSVAYDRYQAQDLTNIIRKWGAPDRVQSYNQMWAGMSPAVNAFEMGARMTPPRITFNNNPINAYCLENCKMIESPDGLNRKPMKASPNQKIDGAITALMGVGRWNELLGVMQ